MIQPQEAPVPHARGRESRGRAASKAVYAPSSVLLRSLHALAEVIPLTIGEE